MANPFSLEGKNAWITGASYGIGFNIAKAFVGAGIKTIIFNDINEAALERGLANYKEAGIENVKGYVCDVTDEVAVKALVEKIHEEVGQIDILVNNAGTILRKPAAEHPDEYWDKVINVNLNSQFVLAREFGRDMVERGWGKIVFTCSLLTFQGGITVPGYAASKGGVGQLVKALANEWAGKGVNVNGIAPGYIATDNTAALRADPVRSRQILERIPAGRWGEASDIAGACVFLCSPAAAYIHGAIIPVDGGWLAR